MHVGFPIFLLKAGISGYINVGVLQEKPSCCDLLLHGVKRSAWLSVAKNY